MPDCEIRYGENHPLSPERGAREQEPRQRGKAIFYRMNL